MIFTNRLDATSAAEQVSFSLHSQCQQTCHPQTSIPAEPLTRGYCRSLFRSSDDYEEYFWQISDERLLLARRQCNKHTFQSCFWTGSSVVHWTVAKKNKDITQGELSKALGAGPEGQRWWILWNLNHVDANSSEFNVRFMQNKVTQPALQYSDRRCLKKHRKQNKNQNPHSQGGQQTISHLLNETCSFFQISYCLVVHN